MNEYSDTGSGGEGPTVEPDLPEACLDGAIAFLRRLRPEGPWTLTAIEPDGPGIDTETFGPETEGKALAWLEARSSRMNLYYMVNPAKRSLSSKGKKEDVLEAVAVWVDVDPKPGEDPAAARAYAVARLMDYRVQPSIVVDSGGGVQALWLLDEPFPIDGKIPIAEDFELYNQHLEIVFGADSCHNCDRVMRLPGTINRPNAKKRAAGRVPRLATLIDECSSWKRNPLGEFTAAPPRSASPTTGQARVQLEGVPPPLASLDELPPEVTPRIRMLIVQGCDPDEPDRYASRSEVTYAVACGMVRGGCTNEQIAAVLLDPDMGISAHTREQKRPLDYAERQIEKARDAVAKDGLGPGDRRVLNPHAPYQIAERLKAELFPTVIHTNDDWLEYDAGAYRDVEDKTVRAVLYRELNAALVSRVTDGEVEYLPFNPDSTKVNKVVARHSG